jgi:hypothetical protein
VEGCKSRHEGDSCKEKSDGSQNKEDETDATSNGGETTPRQEKSVTIEETATADSMPEKRIKTEKSILQRFMEFRGERSLKTLVALFERSPRGMFVQEPPVVISDGYSPVRIILDLKTKGGGALNIALSDAKLVTMRKEGETTWVITVLPDEGTWSACLIMRMDGDNAEFPLVVAPPVKIPKGVTERNFVAELDRFVSFRVAGEKGGNDPLRRIPHEYAFTANYLASTGNQLPKMTSVQIRRLNNSNK